MESRVVSANGRGSRVSGETGELGCGRKRIFLGVSMISVIKNTVSHRHREQTGGHSRGRRGWDALRQ